MCTAHKQHTRRTTRTLRTFCHKPAAAFVAHSTTATKDLNSQQREDKFVQYAGYSRVDPDRRPLRELILDDLEPRPSRSGALHERLGRSGGCVVGTLACKLAHSARYTTANHQQLQLSVRRTSGAVPKNVCVWFHTNSG